MENYIRNDNADVMTHDDRSNDNTPLIYLDDLFHPLQYVFDYLRVKDLHILSTVSIRLREYVEVYCEVKYKKLKVLFNGDFEEYFKDFLFIDREVNWYEEILCSNNDLSSYKRLSRLQRVPVANCYVCWLGDTRYIVKKFDHILNREIVHLKMVCWLDIKHTFQKVKPGSYVTAMRMNIQSGDWPIYADNGTTLFTQWEDMNGFHEVSAEMDSERFNKLRNALATKLKSRHDVIKLTDACVTDYDANGDWFNFCLGPFDVASTCNIKFGLADCNGSWKKGMKWDYIELKRIDQD